MNFDLGFVALVNKVVVGLARFGPAAPCHLIKRSLLVSVRWSSVFYHFLYVNNCAFKRIVPVTNRQNVVAEGLTGLDSRTPPDHEFSSIVLLSNKV